MKNLIVEFKIPLFLFSELQVPLCKEETKISLRKKQEKKDRLKKAVSDYLRYNLLEKSTGNHGLKTLDSKIVLGEGEGNEVLFACVKGKRSFGSVTSDA